MLNFLNRRLIAEISLTNDVDIDAKWLDSEKANKALNVLSDANIKYITRVEHCAWLRIYTHKRDSEKARSLIRIK